MHDENLASDPTPTFAEFASGLWRAMRVGEVTHLIFYVDEVDPPELGNRIYARLTRRMVLTNRAIDRMRRMLEQAGEAPAARERFSRDHH